MPDGDGRDSVATRKQIVHRETRPPLSTLRAYFYDTFGGSRPRAPHVTRGPGVTRSELLVAVDAFAAFVALLRLNRKRRDRSRLKALDRNRLAGFFAVAVGAIVDAGERVVDL